MADILKMATSITYTEEDLNKTTRFMDDSVSHTPISYEHGEATIQGGTMDHELVTNINLVNLITSQHPVSIKVGDTTGTELTNMKAFSYDGDSTTVFVSNPGTDPVKIKFVSAKF